MTLGTLALIAKYGAGNPREFFSVRLPSLLKFQPLKLKGGGLKKRRHRYRIGKGAGMLHKW
ncbi:conserved hypothetical protein [Pseudomonas lundensis]|uniref:Uncharacterized protein n=1 Tax=Pseudomonas lundensis TaxID=86185 RepID=A0AAX2H289_9PSED|nr:conserved hypothetical protein [Pseudomonas lundensis]